MDSEDDARIAARVRGGDVAAFRLLVERRQREVFAVIGTVLPQAADREDAAQETFVAAWRAIASFDPARGTFRAWLLRIARNTALNARRRRAPLPHATEEPAGPPRPDSAEAAGPRLDRALAALPVEQRAAFLLAEVYGLSLAEVAQVEDVPLGTVKSRIGRATERLRAALALPLERER